MNWITSWWATVPGSKSMMMLDSARLTSTPMRLPVIAI
jgi:hypothetical protein